MIISAFILAVALDGATKTSVSPDEYRRKIAYYHVCVTEVLQETGFRELGVLDLDTGENLPVIALASNGPSHQFENGIVASVDVEKDDAGFVLYAHIIGERNGSPAKLMIRDEQKRYRVVTATLEQSDLKREYECSPNVRPYKP